MTDATGNERGARRRPIPRTSEREEALLAMVTALTSELAITRERLDTLERLLESAGVSSQDAIEKFVPDEAQTEAREGIRRRIIGKVFRPLREAAERDVARAKKAQAAGSHSADAADEEFASQ